MTTRGIRENIFLLAIALYTLSSFVVLFLLRRFDDNRLTSWEWTFQGINTANLMLFMASGIILVFFLSRMSFGRKAGILLLFSFGASTLFWTEPEVIIDSSRYFTAAKHLELYGIGYFIREWGKEISAWTDMPLIPFLYGLIFRFAGESRIWIQSFNSLLFSCSALLTYLIGKELWDEDTGFIAGMLLSGIPYLLTQVPLMLVDVGTMFFLLLAIFTFMNGLKKGGIWIVFSAVAIFLSFYSKYSAWLMLTVLPIIFMVFAIPQWKKPGFRIYTFRVIFITGSTALFVGALFFFKFDVFTSQMRLLMQYQKPGLQRWGESFVSTFLFQAGPFISLAALYSLYLAIRNRDAKFLIVLWLPMLVFALHIRRIRYVVMIFPMLAFMASYSITGLRNSRIAAFITGCALVFSLVVGFFAFLPFLKTISAENLKRAGIFLDSLPVANAAVFTLPPADILAYPAVAVPILDLHTDRRIIYNENPDTSTLPRKEIEESALRFTWEQKIPPYYRKSDFSRENTAFVLISNQLKDPPPEDIRRILSGCSLAGSFDTGEELFRYRTAVRVFTCND